MNNYAYLIKAKVKAVDAKNLFCWFSSKTDARADREILNILEDAGIEVGRSADHQLPIRTDWHITDDLPEEGVLDDTWCDRYEIGDDNRTWHSKVKPESSTTQNDAGHSEGQAEPKSLRPVARLRIPQRVIVHLLNDSEVKEISEEQHIQIGQIESDDINQYVQNLIQAACNVLRVNEISAHAEWRMMSALKKIFPREKTFTVGSFEAFMSEWIENPVPSTMEKWTNQSKAEESCNTSNAEPETAVNANTESSVPSYSKTSVRLDEMRTLNNGEIIECEKLPVNLQIAHFWVGGKFTVTPGERAKAATAEMDMDNGYLQNVILAVNSIEPLKHCHSHVRHGLIEAIKQIWPEDGKKPELSLVISFSKEWIDALNDTSTEHKKRRENVLDKWLTKYRKERLASGATAGGLNKTDRHPDLVHTLETLDLEIALALLPFDFDIYDIPKAILRRAKEVVADKESPWKEWSIRLRSCPGILDYSRAAIFAVIRGSAPDIHQFPGSHQDWVTANLTESNHEKPDAHTLELANRSIPVNNAGTTTEQPEVTNLGNGIFSIDGLMNNQATETKETNNTENTIVGNASNDQMEKTIDDENTTATEMLSNQKTNGSAQSGSVPSNEAITLDNDSGHHNNAEIQASFHHLMIDLETMGKNPDAPIVSIGAVFFDPATGQTGAAFYETISLESSMGFGCIPDAPTIEWWLKQSSEARSAILMDTLSLDDALSQFAEFVRGSASPAYTQLWGNGASFDNVLLRCSFERISMPCELKFFNDRDVRTMVELGKAIGINPRQEIPFDGEQHNALADALHQVKYVSAIWQRLIQN